MQISDNDRLFSKSSALEFSSLNCSKKLLNVNFGVEDATPQNENRYKKVSIDVTDEGADYMAILNYKDGATPTRYARAFIFANGQYYYSKVICNK